MVNWGHTTTNSKQTNNFLPRQNVQAANQIVNETSGQILKEIQLPKATIEVNKITKIYFYMFVEVLY